MQRKKRASVFIYILFLVNISLIMGIVVYNNSFILSNNVSVGNNVMDYFLNIKNKGNIAINAIKLYNSNGNGYLDNISCPTNITMSGTTLSGFTISTQIKYSTGNIYCLGDYNGNEFRIYFNNDFSDFSKAYFFNDIVNINESGGFFVGDRNFNDGDLTLISFNSDGIGGLDSYDDNFNSDDYRVTSTGSIYYPNNFADDDVIPRKIFFGNIGAGEIQKNIFWNNYKTNDFVSNNTNNNDNINIKIGDVENAYMYLDLFNYYGNLYDIKIVEFNRDIYKNENRLLSEQSLKGIDNPIYSGYIQNNSGSLSISKNKTGNEYVFDFKNKDYGIFISNKSDTNLIYRLRAETSTGTGIYINPIDDSKDLSIEVMSNHISEGVSGEYMGETFIYVGLK